eukprot:UN01879
MFMQIIQNGKKFMVHMLFPFLHFKRLLNNVNKIVIKPIYH